MPKEPSDDMKDLWRNQTTESPQVSVEHFRHKARKLQKKGRRDVYRWYAFALAFLGITLAAFGTVQEMTQRVGLGMLAVGAVVLAFQAHRKLRADPLATDADLATSIEFYRRHLEHHRDYGRQMVWSLAPLFAGIAVFLYPPLVAIAKDVQLAPRILPFSILMAMWVVLFFYLRRRKLDKLRRKLDKLAELEKEIRS